MGSVLVAVLWAGVAVYAVHRVTTMCRDLVTQLIAAAWPPASPPTVVPTLPPDLQALVFQYPEEWAQDDVVKAMHEKYAQTQDWNMVRQAFGVAPAGDAMPGGA